MFHFTILYGGDSRLHGQNRYINSENVIQYTCSYYAFEVRTTRGLWDFTFNETSKFASIRSVIFILAILCAVSTVVLLSFIGL